MPIGGVHLSRLDNTFVYAGDCDLLRYRYRDTPATVRQVACVQ